MRQVDNETFAPLGPPIRREPTTEPKQEWTPTGTPGIERAPDGKLRNIAPTPPSEPVYLGNPGTWGRASEAIR